MEKAALVIIVILFLVGLIFSTAWDFFLLPSGGSMFQGIEAQSHFFVSNIPLFNLIPGSGFARILWIGIIIVSLVVIAMYR